MKNNRLEESLNAKFEECEPCSKKPGSPQLCSSCLRNRRLIARLQGYLRSKVETEEILRNYIKNTRPTYLMQAYTLPLLTG